MGYPFFDEGDYNLNLIGIRTDDSRSEIFNDWLFVAFRQGGHEQLLSFQMTTDPGVYWLRHPMSVLGTAIVKPGHYPSLWHTGKHRNQYKALIQYGNITVYRDNNLDQEIDMDGSTEDGMFGINLHRAGRLADTNTKVGRWSAGCQVVQSVQDFELLMALIKRAAQSWGETFSYTLLTEHQAWNL